MIQTAGRKLERPLISDLPMFIFERSSFDFRNDLHPLPLQILTNIWIGQNWSGSVIRNLYIRSSSDKTTKEGYVQYEDISITAQSNRLAAASSQLGLQSGTSSVRNSNWSTDINHSGLYNIVCTGTNGSIYRLNNV